MPSKRVWIPVEIDDPDIYGDDRYCDAWIDGDRSGMPIHIRQDNVVEPEPIDIVFDGPNGPEGPRLVETENSKGEGIQVGKWIKRPDGYWVLRIERAPSGVPIAVIRARIAEWERVRNLPMASSSEADQYARRTRIDSRIGTLRYLLENVEPSNATDELVGKIWQLCVRARAGHIEPGQMTNEIRAALEGGEGD